MTKKNITFVAAAALASLALFPANKVKAATNADPKPVATTTATDQAAANNTSAAKTNTANTDNKSANTKQAAQNAGKAQNTTKPSNTNAAQSTEARVVPTKAVGRINYAGPGKVALWSNYEKPHTVVGYVANNTAWKVLATAVLPNGHVMYSLGRKQWVPAEYLQLITSPSSATKPAAQPASDNSFKVQKVNGVVVVTYNGRGKVALWSNYTAPRHITGNYVANASRWQASAIATNDKGDKWYKLGLQWLPATYGYMVNEAALVNGNQAAAKPAAKPAQKHGNFTIQDETGTVVVAYHGREGAPVYSSYDGKTLVRRVANNARLNASQVAKNKNGKQWFKIGDKEWISDDNAYLQWNTIDQTAKSGQHGVLRVAYNGRGKVAIWSGYGQGRHVVKYLPKGSYWKYFDAAKDQNGNNWYNLGGKQWISGEYVAL